MRAQAQPLDRRRQAGIGCHEDDDGIGIGILDATDQFDAIETGRHTNVGQHHVKRLRANDVEGIFAAGRLTDTIADPL